MEAKSYTAQVAKNKNLLNEIFSFNNLKDHSQLAQVCRQFNELTQKFDLYYKDDLNSFFYLSTINSQ